MENVQSLRGAQPSKRDERISDNKQNVMRALRVVPIRYFVKREKLWGPEPLGKLY